MLFSAVIFEHFSKNRVIISVVAAKIWYLKKCTVFIGPPWTWHTESQWQRPGSCRDESSQWTAQLQTCKHFAHCSSYTECL